MPEELEHEGLHADLTRDIIGAAVAVQKALGPGLLESAYEACLAHELSLHGYQVQRQVPLVKSRLRRFVMKEDPCFSSEPSA